MATGECIIDWGRFSEWIHSFCIVTFDLELGQALELIYPPHVTLSERERTNICYLAFPDSNSGCMGDTEYHVRLRCAPDGAPPNHLTPNHVNYNRHTTDAHRADPGHLWGFVYFRQTRAPHLPRGYFQKSFVLLSRLPFVSLFTRIAHHMAPMVFEATDSEVVLKEAASAVAKWPPLAQGPVVLPLLARKFSACIGDGDNDTQDESCERITSLHEPDTLHGLLSLLPHVQLLWELVLTGEPIVVMASSPADSCHLVHCLISMIAPLTYSGEARPYFTIHDSEFREFTTKSNGAPGVILGVTNPFFSKTLQHWPHTIRLTDAHGPSGGATLPRVKSTGRLLEATPGVYTHYRAHLQQERSLVRQVMGRTGRPMPIQSAMLKRHLLELTQSFMIPLERYMGSLMPLMRDVSPFGAPPTPHHFKQEDFLATLPQAGPQLTTSLRGDWEGLYRRFFRSGNFRTWHEQRHTQLTHALHALHLQALASVDLSAWMVGKHEVEVVDMVLKLRHKIASCTDGDDGTRGQLERHLRDIEQRLPEDLRLLLKSNSPT
ncbi:protein DENND6A [Phlebotomus papatasi]|uniref:protein DENND6A n=1 Tax=Phlebotomus papatasi TaxID=29031 RepID=UPI0024838329|nr:protein DENND6A [Phlebotomus papatasi]